jgi:hypothetical protein
MLAGEGTADGEVVDLTQDEFDHPGGASDEEMGASQEFPPSQLDLRIAEDFGEEGDSRSSQNSASSCQSASSGRQVRISTAGQVSSLVVGYAHIAFLRRWPSVRLVVWPCCRR